MQAFATSSICSSLVEQSHVLGQLLGQFRYGGVSSIQIRLHFLNFCSVSFFKLTFLVVKIDTSLFFSISQLFFKLKLDIQKFIYDLRVHFFQIFVRYFLESIYVIRIVGVNFINFVIIWVFLSLFLGWPSFVNSGWRTWTFRTLPARESLRS